VPLVYDFWGFPEHYYQVRCAAPGAPDLAQRVRKLLRGPGTPVQDVPGRGLDHGAYVPLVEMFPAADIPCRVSTRSGSWTSGGGLRHCGTRVC
jgi:4,5-DOPA dioxygenase extradiol